MPKFEYRYANVDRASGGKDHYSMGLFAYSAPPKGPAIPVEFLNMLGEVGWELIDFGSMLFRKKKD